MDGPERRASDSTGDLLAAGAPTAEQAALEDRLLKPTFLGPSPKEIVKREGLDRGAVRAAVTRVVAEQLRAGRREDAASLVLAWRLSRADLARAVELAVRNGDQASALREARVSLLAFVLMYNPPPADRVRRLARQYGLDESELQEAGARAARHYVIHERPDMLPKVAAAAGLGPAGTKRAVLSAVEAAIRQGLWEDTVEFRTRDLVAAIAGQQGLSGEELNACARRAGKRATAEGDPRMSRRIADRYDLDASGPS